MEKGKVLNTLHRLNIGGRIQRFSTWSCLKKMACVLLVANCSVSASSSQVPSLPSARIVRYWISSWWIIPLDNTNITAEMPILPTTFKWHDTMLTTIQYNTILQYTIRMIQYTHASRCTANSLLIVNKITIWVSYRLFQNIAKQPNI